MEKGERGRTYLVKMMSDESKRAWNASSFANSDLQNDSPVIM